MSFSVVMATFNRREHLPRVLEPLLGNDATDELVVVVDGCHDGSIEYLRERAAADPRLKPVWVENGGAVKAQQTGIETATGDAVLVIDDDVLASPGLVSGHARHHDGDGKLVVVGYMPTPKPSERAPGSFTSELYHDVYEFRADAFEHNADTVLTGLWGGNVSMTRQALLDAGGIGGAYELPYHYDWELGLRLKRAGFRGAFDRSLAAQHLHSRSYDSFLRECRNQGRAIWVIQNLHGELIAPEHIRERNAHRSTGFRALLRASDRPRLYPGIRDGLDQAVRLAGRARLWPLERKLASALGHVERRRGEYEESLRLSPEEIRAAGDRVLAGSAA